MNIIVTGGCGFIGTNFVRVLLNNEPGADITIIDKLTYAGKLEHIKDIRSKIKFSRCDIGNKKEIEKIIKDADIVVNFAAETHVDKSIINPLSFLKSNIFGLYGLLEAARKADLKRFVQISTDEVYGSKNSGSFNEDDMLKPSNPYSATKAAGDHLVYSYVNTYGLNAIVTRCTNNYGPYQNPEKLIPKAIVRALTNKPIPVYARGRNVRDWIYVEDHCRAVMTALKKGKKGETYNIAGENEKPNIEIVKMILDILGKSTDLIKFVEDRPGHDFRYSIECKKIKKLGWKRKYGLKDGLRKTVDWYQKNAFAVSGRIK
ncbi:MAG: dTDP-glucose 4,6-dehydratase [Candidatus Aenigmarchaeota archaeon]|nr:dTDP-glucose 4,6-dehydratase [Candidatus Aenigmarchaeota archaeon]